jgi:hypothetical protein
MSNEVDWRTFNYWDPEHYVTFKVTGSKETCIEAFNREREKFPTMQYGTVISDKKFSGPIDECFAVIKRFKTKDLCRIHHSYPPTYVREGKVL